MEARMRYKVVSIKEICNRAFYDKYEWWVQFSDVFLVDILRPSAGESNLNFYSVQVKKNVSIICVFQFWNGLT